MGIRNIRNHIKKTLILSVFLLTLPVSAKIHEYETTHLKAMGGTGVGSILTEDSAFLNPASLSFFTTSSVYFQKDSAALNINNVKSPDPKSMGIVLADGNPSLSGSLSYVTQTEDIYKRKRWGLTLTGPTSDKSSLGISIRKSNDENTATNQIDKYYQSVLGITHSLDEKFTIGIIAYDPFKSKAHETKAMIGLQYILMNYITAAFDFGGNYTASEMSKTLVYKAALQFKVLDDFFLSFGGFSDKIHSEKGNGFGLSWIQPRLSFEFAIKSTTLDGDSTVGLQESKFKETSFAASIRF